MKKLDWVAIFIIFLITSLIVIVVFIGNNVPIAVTCKNPSPCDQVSPFGYVIFEFSRPVQAEQVEKLWQTTPITLGEWDWLDEQHVRWKSTKPLSAEKKVILEFLSGQAGQNGERINRNFQWEVSVRPPQIIATRKIGEGQELFVYGIDDNVNGIQLTNINGRVYDFRVSPDGEEIAFSVVNDINGIDLWVVKRDGTDQQILLDCGGDQCSTPEWSPLMNEMVYTRKGSGLDPNGSKGVPRIWILNVTSGETAPLFSDPQEIGYGPKWSPDGEWLSIWDGLNGGIKIVNRNNGDSFMIESAAGDIGCWTPDSEYLYYSNMVSGEAGFRNVIQRADIKNQLITTVFGGDINGGGVSINYPGCSPSDNSLVVKIQPNVKVPGARLLLFFPENNDGILISDDLSRIPGFYSWTPDGEHLTYQTLKLGGNENDVETWVWDKQLGKTKLITNGIRMPQWLP